MTPAHPGREWTTPRQAAHIVLLMAAAVCCADAATGQTTDADNAWTLGVGVGLAGAYDLGARSGTLGGSGVPRGSSFVLFDTESAVERAPFLDLRIGYRFGGRLALDGRAARAGMSMSTRVSGDIEAASGGELQALELTQYVFEGSVRFGVRRLAFAEGRAVPFLSLGVGHLREVHEDRVLVETGWLYHAGGGVEYLRSLAGRRLSGMGVRADARANLRDGGVALDERRRVFPTIAGSFFVTF